MRPSMMRSYWYRHPAYACCNTTTSSYEPYRSAFASSRRHMGYHSRAHGGMNGRDFGVRRPLRYLRYHLDLDEGQSRRMAAVLNRVKLEREQHRVDTKRADHAAADLLMSDQVSPEEVKVALHARVTSTERLQTEIARSLAEISEILDDDQRQQFAELIRSGVIAL